jgi:hypothetical protein
MRGSPCSIELIAAVLLSTAPLTAQRPPPLVLSHDSVMLPAGAHLGAGALRQFFLGQGYRGLWTTSMSVPVLDLEAFAGGLRPVRSGGGKQTKSLYFETPTGAMYVFRSVGKDTEWGLPSQFEGTVVAALSRDQVSTSHPAANLVVAALMDAADVLHATPQMAVMPADTSLGEFLEDFSGRLGTIEEYPERATRAGAFAGALHVVGSDSLFRLLSADNGQQVDPRTLLAARLMDLLVSDWDRHPGNWRWAMVPDDSQWQPIPRDRDKAFGSYSGVIGKVAGLFGPALRPFRDRYPSVAAVTWHSDPMDRRLLAGLERSVWDSVTASLMDRVTDSAVDAAVMAMPAEYHGSAPQLAAILKRRRDLLPDIAGRVYDYLASVVDIHATDAAERATIARVADGMVEVRIESQAGAPVFRRRFDDRETREIRLYLHGGDDSALVTGTAPSRIQVRVIGGNGTNRLVDASGVSDRRGRARLYDNGEVEGISYGKDEEIDRRPWVREHGQLMPPARDRGMQWAPGLGLGIDPGFGAVPRLGMSRVRYAFGHRPYSSRVTLEGEYSTGVNAFRIGLTAEQRREHSPLYFATSLRVSSLEIIHFHGLGNDSPDSAFAGVTSFDVRQRRWLAHPVVALGLGPRSSLSLGPIVKYAQADSVPGTLLAATRPYGFGNFGQAGARLGLRYDGRDRPGNARSGVLIDASASWYPVLWDVRRPFGDLGARVTAYRELPIPLHPILALRAGGRKVFGTFPYHEAAFVGGRATALRFDAQRYAGDAALFGTAEVRLPVARFPFILPLDVGIYGSLDAVRVYVDGDSPGGWHTNAGAGVWIGILDPSNAISIALTSGEGRTGVLITTGLSF